MATDDKNSVLVQDAIYLIIKFYQDWSSLLSVQK